MVDPLGARAGEHRAWLALQCAGALRPREVIALLRESADPSEVLGRLPARLRPSPQRLRAAERALERVGGRLVPWGTDEYPAGLTPLVDAAPVIAVRGDVAALREPAVGVVGSRIASAYGLEVARRVSSELARAGLVIVSGLAFGIDKAAHTAALDAGGRSIAVQACGLDHVYPAAHRALAARIAGAGAVVSEFAPGVRPRPGFFPLRNRLISGLALALVVVEARERSGSLVTARHAAEQGVEVFAVPGPITLPGHAGTNQLLRDGAWPLVEPDDVLAVIGARAAACASPLEASRADVASPVLEALRLAPASADALASRLGQSADEVATALVELELEGRATRERDGLWHALG